MRWNGRGSRESSRSARLLACIVSIHAGSGQTRNFLGFSRWLRLVTLLLSSAEEAATARDLGSGAGGPTLRRASGHRPRHVGSPARQAPQNGSRYLRTLLDRYDGNIELAVASYNAGPTAVDNNRGIPPYPEVREDGHSVHGEKPNQGRRLTAVLSSQFLGKERRRKQTERPHMGRSVCEKHT